MLLVRSLRMCHTRASVDGLEKLASNIMQTAAATRASSLNRTSMQNMDTCEQFCTGYSTLTHVDKDSLIHALSARLKETTAMEKLVGGGRADLANLLCFWVLGFQSSPSHPQLALRFMPIVPSLQSNGDAKCSPSLVMEHQFSHFARSIGHLQFGVKFLADLRADILDLTNRCSGAELDMLQAMERQLKDLLSIWFSLGLMTLQRVTWDSPCSLLEKITDYESVHPVRGWGDLKRRVGAYRRCFVLCHPSMPTEPLVVLHVALTDTVSDSIDTIISRDHQPASSGEQERLDTVKCAIFYSINATQKGLRGIEFGNHLIKNAVVQLKSELIQLEHFSTLSPIPRFRPWLIHALKANTHSVGEIMKIVAQTTEKMNASDLLDVLHADWNKTPELTEKLKPILMQICAHYLYKEKHRAFALDTVAHFHLRNGATMWRLNWAADLSRKGLANSFGMMVNYKYFLDKTEMNSKLYSEEKVINVDPQISCLLSNASKL